MSIFDLPAGATDASPQWQSGYDDGNEELAPKMLDAIYVSGWCHGYCEAVQCSSEDAVEAYRARRAEGCAICGRPLGQAADPLSIDCGGDCWGCVGAAEYGAGVGEPERSHVEQEIELGLRDRSGAPRPFGEA